MKINKAVIPAAGLGTRFLPVTKSMPKEMLPIVDTPAIHFVVKEAIEAGIDDIIIITGRRKRAIEDYFDESPELEIHLEKQGKKDKLKMIRDISQMVNIHYIRQEEPRGLPDAILKAEKHVDGQPFAVLLVDDIIKGEPCIKQLINVYGKYESPVLAAERIPKEESYKYGIIDGKLVDERLWAVEKIIEKSSPDKDPSNIASVGRYIFMPDIFDFIKSTPVGINNELQIADSINLLMEKQKVYAFEFSGKRYDVGDKFGYVKAIIDFSVEKEEIKEKVRRYIEGLVMK